MNALDSRSYANHAPTPEVQAFTVNFVDSQSEESSTPSATLAFIDVGGETETSELEHEVTQ